MFKLKYLPNREPGEEIIFFLRRHSFVLTKSLVVFFLIALLPLAVYYIAHEDLAGWLDDKTFVLLFRLLIISFYLFWWLLLYYVWLDYFLDVWIVTNHRILNIEQKGLFNRVVAENKLFRIQDVTSEQKGLFPTFFNYGEVYIQTAGSEQRVVFEQIPQPYHVARHVIKLVERRKKKVVKKLEQKPEE